MPLIKGANSARVVRHAVVLDLGDLNRQAEEIIDEARAEAGRIVADARAEAQSLIDGAAERGHAEGVERGLTEGRTRGEEEGRQSTSEEYRDRFNALSQSFTEALKRWEEQRRAMFLAAREDVLAFALAMGRKVIGRVIELDRTVIEDQLRESLALLSRPSMMTVVIHPDDRPLVEAVLPTLLAELTRCEHADIAEDASITPGGCVIRTGDGLVDATIENQIDRIVRTLLPERDDRAEEAPTSEATPGLPALDEAESDEPTDEEGDS
ncbi:MAG: FliH/SctL family protein [Planctomycetota bacterium]|nr:FliH/SctL family protein [Planctomycetota bacterium]